MTELDQRRGRLLGDEAAVAERPGAPAALGRAGVRDGRAHDQDQEHAGCGRDRQKPRDRASRGIGHGPPISAARVYSRTMRAMFDILMPFGQTAWHSPSFEQEPKPSASIWLTIAVAREARSVAPWGS